MADLTTLLAKFLNDLYAGVLTVGSSNAVVAGGATQIGMTASSVVVAVGSGAPTMAAAQGSLYLRTDGTTTNDRLYVNTNGTTGWAAVTTAS
jgi:hypothetical protein